MRITKQVSIKTRAVDLMKKPRPRMRPKMREALRVGERRRRWRK